MSRPVYTFSDPVGVVEFVRSNYSEACFRCLRSILEIIQYGPFPEQCEMLVVTPMPTVPRPTYSVAMNGVLLVYRAYRDTPRVVLLSAVVVE